MTVNHKAKPILFKLFGRNGKCRMTWKFDDNVFIGGFFTRRNKIYFKADIVIEVAEFDSTKKAVEVCKNIVQAYHAHKHYNLPSQ